MFSIKVLQFSEADFKRVLGYILCPNQRGIILLTSPKMFCCYEYYRLILKLVLKKMQEGNVIKLKIVTSLFKSIPARNGASNNRPHHAMYMSICTKTKARTFTDKLSILIARCDCCCLSVNQGKMLMSPFFQ